VPRAIVFDCDGVLADTERDAHLVAFNQVFAENGLPLRWDDQEYGRLLKVGGGKERLLAYFTPERARQWGLPADDEGRKALFVQWHRRKSEIFTELIRGGSVPARPGVRRLIDEALTLGWQVAVASTSAEPSVRAVLEHAVGPARAGEVSVFAGDVVAAKKPAPDIYLLAVNSLKADPSTTFVVEDSAVGLTAARAAGLSTLVTPSTYTVNDDFSGAVAVVSDLGEPGAPATVIRDDRGLATGGVVTAANLGR